MKPIRLSGHARLRTGQRGATEQEVAEAIRQGPWTPAEQGRKECQKDFIFGREWNGRSYAAKRVRPIFVESPQEILVVTVFVYFF